MNYYFIWIPALIICSAIWALIAKISNDNPSSLWFYFLFLSIPVWAFVVRISKNLLFDGLLYDFILTLSYALTFIYFGFAKDFSAYNWIGLLLALLGIILLKI